MADIPTPAERYLRDAAECRRLVAEVASFETAYMLPEECALLAQLIAAWTKRAEHLESLARDAAGG